MKYFVILLVLIISSGLITPQIFADDNYAEFIIDGYTITTNSNNVTDISLDWDSKVLPEGTVTFSEPFTGSLEIQIPKSMPRTMNLDFKTSLFLITNDAVDGQHVFESENMLYDDRITETESECFYILSMNLENVEYFEIVTGSVTAGRWESVTINNQKCNNVDNDFKQQINEKMTLKQQLSDKMDWDDMVCPNTQHVLTERSNGKIACVYPTTAEKFGWYIHHPIEMPVISLFKIIKENETFEVNYEIKNGKVIDMINVDKDNSLIINIDSSNDGQIILYIPHGVIDPIPKDSGDNWLFVLINGEEVESKQIVDDELNRTVTINFNHVDPVIEIIASYWT